MVRFARFVVLGWCADPFLSCGECSRTGVPFNPLPIADGASRLGDINALVESSCLRANFFAH